MTWPLLHAISDSYSCFLRAALSASQPTTCMRQPTTHPWKHDTAFLHDWSLSSSRCRAVLRSQHGVGLSKFWSVMGGS